jgi:hypothetical protein
MICLNLIESFVSRADSLPSSHQVLIDVILPFYDSEYTKLNDKHQEFFWGMLAANGARCCLANAQNRDLTREIGI